MKTIKYFLALVSTITLISCGGGGGGNDGSDNPTPTDPQISVSNASISEGDSGTTDLVFTISLNKASNSDINVNYATSDNTAAAGTDYTATNGTATISAGNTSTTVTVSISGDTDNESDESFTLTLSNAVGATLETAIAAGIIIDDDDVVAVSGGPYMLYGDSTNMYAVDTSNPTLTYLLGPQISVPYESSTLITGDLNADKTALLNTRSDSFVYYKANKFWRIDLSEGSNLTPVQISSANVGYICGMQIFGNSIVPDDSYIFYVAAATSGDCINNSQAYRIQAGDDSSSTPLSISGAPYIRIETIKTGDTPEQVTGFLVRNDADYTVKKYDVNFSAPVTLLDGDTQAIPLDGGNGFANDASFYLVDDALYSYTHNAASAIAMHTITPGSRFDHLQGVDFLCNTTNCYFVEINNETGVQSLYMTAINGSGSAQVGAAFTNDKILRLTRTSGKLYITTKPVGGGQSLYAVNLPDGTPTLVDSLSGSDYFTRLVTIGESLYYNSVNSSADSISAIVRKDDDSVPVGPVVNAAWAGFAFPTTRLNSSFAPPEIILAEEVTTPAAGVKYTVYNTATATAGTVLGTFEGSFVGMGFGASGWAGTYLFGLGTNILGGALLNTSSAFQLDVFFADTTMADSLYRVTDSSTLNEGPLL